MKHVAFLVLFLVASGMSSRTALAQGGSWCSPGGGGAPTPPPVADPPADPEKPDAGKPAKPKPKPGTTGADPYKPFENNKLDWLKPERESAAPALCRMGGAKPGVLLFVSEKDERSCCAANFERTVFRDKNVVELAKDNFITVRLDRTSDPAKPFNVTKPTIVILDGEGDEVARFNKCTDPKEVLAALDEAYARYVETVKKTTEWTPRVATVEGLVASDKMREAVEVVVKAKDARLTKALKEKVQEWLKSFDERSTTLLSDAKAKEPSEAGAAWRLYGEVRDTYVGLPNSAKAKAAAIALEKDPANKPKITAARAEIALDRARELVQAGKERNAIDALRRLCADFPKTDAAVEARKLINELTAKGSDK